MKRMTWTGVLRGVGVALLLVMLAACASNIQNHSFEFNTGIESPEAEILDYRYGESKQPSARASEYEKSTGGVRQRFSMGGDILVGDSLYVKWRIKATGVVLEDTVNLKAVLPRNIDHNYIHFTIKDRQLFVYLVTTERMPRGETSVGPRASNYLKTLTLSSNYGRQVSH